MPNLAHKFQKFPKLPKLIIFKNLMNNLFASSGTGRARGARARGKPAPVRLPQRVHAAPGQREDPLHGVQGGAEGRWPEQYS